ASFIGVATVAAPYMAAIGKVSVKPSVQHIYNNDKPQDTLFRPDQGETSRRSPERWSAVLTNTPLAATLAIWWMDEKVAGPPPLLWGVRTLAFEIAHAFHYFGFGAALLGLWWFRDRFTKVAGARVVLVLCLVLAALLLRLALGVHYLSERHTLVLVL